MKIFYRWQTPRAVSRVEQAQTLDELFKAICKDIPVKQKRSRHGARSRNGIGKE